MQAVAAFFASVITFVSGLFGSPLLASNSPANVPADQPAAAAVAHTEIVDDPFNDPAAASVVAEAVAAAFPASASPLPSQGRVLGEQTTNLSPFLSQFSTFLRSLDAHVASPIASGGTAYPRYGGYVPQSDGTTALASPVITGGSVSVASSVGASSGSFDALSAGTLNVSGAAIFASVTIASTNASSSTITNLTAGNATTTSLFSTTARLTSASTTNLSADAATFAAATSTSLSTATLRLASTDCSAYGNGGKLTTDAFGTVICASDQGAGGGVVGGADTQIQFNDGGLFGADTTFTFNKTADRLTLVNASTTNLTASYASSTVGHFGTLSADSLSLVAALPVSSGGTGVGNPAAAGVLLGSYAGGAWQQIATSSLGLLTTNVAEGANLYFTNARADARADSRINATSSIGTLLNAPNLATVATSLTGFLKATAGALSTSVINLASDITGTLGVNNGGTGWSNIAAGAIPYGNGSSALATTSAGTAGQVLAFLNGVPTWTATTTFSAPLSYANGAVSLAQANGGTNGYLAAADWTLFNGKISSSSLSASFPLSYNSATGVFTTAFSTTTANSWSALNTFTNSTSTLATLGNAWLTGQTASTLLALDANKQVVSTSTIGWNLLKGPASSIFAFDASGNPTATTSIGVNYLAGVFPIAKGGTNASSQTTNGLNYYNGTSITSGSLFTYDGTTTALTANSANTSGTVIALGIGGTQSTANTGGYMGLNINPAYNAASGNTLAIMYGMQTNPRNTGGGLIPNLRGVYSLPQNTGSGEVTGMYGVVAQPQNSGTGTSTVIAGFYATPGNTSTGTTTTMYGLLSQPRASTGSVPTMYGALVDCGASGASAIVSTCYGLRIGTFARTGTVTTSYGLYQDDTIANNYFGGNVGIGTSTPWGKLSIKGSGTGTGLAFAVADSANTLRVVIQDNGNVGIGTTTPWKKLSIVGDLSLTGAFFDTTASAGTSGMIMQTTGTGVRWVATSSLGVADDAAVWKKSVAGTGVNASASAFNAASQALFLNGTYTGTGTGPYALLSIDDTATKSGIGFLNGLWIAHNINGGDGDRNAFQPILTINHLDGTSGDFYSSAFPQAYVKTNLGGTALTPKGSVYGNNGLAQLESGATFIHGVIGGEFDVSVQSGASVKDKSVMSLISVNSDAVKGTQTDAMLIFTRDNTSTALWDYGIAFGRYDSQWPFGATSTLIGTYAPNVGSRVALNGVDLSAVTFSAGGCAFKSTGFCVDPSGNVGIGTTTPAYTLDVKGFINTDGTAGGYKLAGNTILYASTTNSTFTAGASAAAAWMSASSTLWNNVAVGIGALATAPTSPLTTYSTSPNNTAVGINALGANRNGYWNVAVGYNALAANVDGGASVAIGHEALMNYTDIEGGIAVGNQALRAATSSLANIAIGNTALYNLTNGGGLNIALGHHVFFDATTAAGNVGIGYNTGFDIASGAFNTFLGHNTGRGITTGSYNTILGAQVTGLPPTLSNNIILADGAGTIRAQIDSSGNVGVGTTTPVYKLDVQDGINQTTFRTSGRAMAQEFTSEWDAYLSSLAGRSIYFRSGPTNPNLMKIDSSGSIQFNTYGAGTLTTDASGNITASSDERLKNIDGDFTRGLADVLAITPINYHWKEASGLDNKTQYSGFSAQNVQAAIPEAVGVSPSGYLSLNDRPVLAAVVNAIKEIASITGTFKDALVAWLGDAGNGIGSLFAADITATSRLCVSDGANDSAPLCITKSQLAALLNTNGASQGINFEGSPPIEPDTPPSDEPDTSPQATSTATTTPPSAEQAPSIPPIDEQLATSTPSTDIGTSSPQSGDAPPKDGGNPFNPPEPSNDNPPPADNADEGGVAPTEQQVAA